tara:strand:- start:3021 stop:3560 length:540 start_codon:yes stop_codon:yes gene_type:complete
MAHFALLDQDKNVMKVIVVNNNVITDENGVEQESLGVEFCRKLYNLPNSDFKQTSYNTRSGVYYTPSNDTSVPPSVDPDQSKAFRKNFASVGMKYDESLDAFVCNKPLNNPSWIFDEPTGSWIPPVDFPSVLEINATRADIFWVESETRWEGAASSDDKSNGFVATHYWDSSSSSWTEK